MAAGFGPLSRSDIPRFTPALAFVTNPRPPVVGGGVKHHFCRHFSPVLEAKPDQPDSFQPSCWWNDLSRVGQPSAEGKNTETPDSDRSTAASGRELAGPSTLMSPPGGHEQTGRVALAESWLFLVFLWVHRSEDPGPRSGTQKIHMGFILLLFAILVSRQGV